MLSTRKSALLGLLLAPACLFAACSGSSAGATSSGTTAGSGAGTTAATSGGGLGGFAGPSTSSSSVSSATSAGGGMGGSGGTGGSGGAGGCVGPQGTGVPVAACSALPLAAMMGICTSPMGGTNQNPPGYTACVAANNVFTAGAWEALVACLGMITAADACDVSEVQTCLTQTDAALCDDPTNDTFCQMVHATCEAEMPPEAFDLGTCETELRPWNDTALGDITSCVAGQAPGTACQSTFDTCQQMELTF